MHKLKKRPQFQKVYKKGKSFKTPYIILSILANNLDYNRIGVSAALKNTGISVRRNRTRRLLTETYRLTEDSLKRGFDMVLTCRRDLSQLGLKDVTTEINKLYRGADILQ
ncbi:MAG: ribonuclease P protein component [Candidatus Omnitrophica bacterium]|nr:ribonuclease P protein component [Candidatus Omnitrophota bacterium]